MQDDPVMSELQRWVSCSLSCGGSIWLQRHLLTEAEVTCTVMIETLDLAASWTTAGRSKLIRGCVAKHLPCGFQGHTTQKFLMQAVSARMWARFSGLFCLMACQWFIRQHRENMIADGCTRAADSCPRQDFPLLRQYASTLRAGSYAW